VVKNFSAVAEYWPVGQRIGRPNCRRRIGKAYLDLWGSAVRRLAGEQAEPRDRAIAARQAILTIPSGSRNQVFRFCNAALSAHDSNGRRTSLRNAEGLGSALPARRPNSTSQQIANALAPSNFVLTTPEVLRENAGGPAATTWFAA